MAPRQAPAAQTPRQAPRPDLYEQYPLLKRVKNVFGAVQNTEESTGNAQHRILKTPQQPGVRGRLPWKPYMNRFNWSAIKNDPRLTAAQKKTVNKILVSLKVNTRDEKGNRPALNFNIQNQKFLNPNGSVNIAKVNREVRNRLPKQSNWSFSNNETFYNSRSQLNNNNNNNQQTYEQHLRNMGEF